VDLRRFSFFLSLKTRGVDISDRGVKVKTNKRFDRDDYVDATQRSFIKAMGAASFGQASPAGTPTPKSTLNTPPLQRATSSQSYNSSISTEEKKKKGSGFMKRALSGSKEK
jgi:hypothetical protein